jgi:hypothetical protein
MHPDKLGDRISIRLFKTTQALRHGFDQGICDAESILMIAKNGYFGESRLLTGHLLREKGQHLSRCLGTISGRFAEPFVCSHVIICWLRSAVRFQQTIQFSFIKSSSSLCLNGKPQGASQFFLHLPNFIAPNQESSDSGPPISILQTAPFRKYARIFLQSLRSDRPNLLGES